MITKITCYFPKFQTYLNYWYHCSFLMQSLCPKIEASKFWGWVSENQNSWCPNDLLKFSLNSSYLTEKCMVFRFSVLHVMWARKDFVFLIFTFNSPFFPWRRCFSLHSKEKWFWVLAGYSGHRHWVPGHLPPATVLCSFYSKYYIQKLLWKNWISSGINHVNS